MSTIFGVSASGLLAQQRKMDVASNNIANMGTVGFRRSRTVMEDTKYEQLPTNAEIAAAQRAGLTMPKEVGTGVELAAIQRLFSSGIPYQTDQPTDLVIEGRGFFTVRLPDGTEAYTRDGAFEVDANGRLVTQNGYLVNPPITVPPGATGLAVDQLGNVSAMVPGQATPTQLGRIRIATFPNEAGLLAAGANLFIATPSSGNPTAGDPGADGRGLIMAGYLENSNVDMIEETTRMMEAQRAYQMNIKALQMLDEMVSLADNIRR